MSRSKHSYGGRTRHTSAGHTSAGHTSAGHTSAGHSKQRSQDAGFRCVHCRRMVPIMAVGSEHRNHCPLCLWSRHVDNRPGDRASPCQGKMEPISIWVKDKLEWALVHRCTSCGVVKTNRIAGDDNEFVLMSLASKPMALPPFPLDRMP